MHQDLTVGVMFGLAWYFLLAAMLNAAAALFIAGKAKSLMEGWTLAEETIDSGKAQKKLAELAAK